MHEQVREAIKGFVLGTRKEPHESLSVKDEFKGTIIYSYDEPIAFIPEDLRTHAYVTAQRFSATTSRHSNFVRRSVQSWQDIADMHEFLREIAEEQSRQKRVDKPNKEE